MEAKKLDGKFVASAVRDNLRRNIGDLMCEGVTPHLAAILIGEDPPSRRYVAQKQKACGELGIESSVYELPDKCNAERLTDKISELNENEEVNGILVQLPLKNLARPLPLELEEITYKVMEYVRPEKDVDGFHTKNATRFIRGQPCLPPATARGIITLLDHYQIPLRGSEVTIIGVSEIVGRPLGNVLANRKQATVTFCHIDTRDSDIVISAIGKPHHFNADSIKDGAVAIDVGMSRIEDPQTQTGYRFVGDFDESVWEKASYVSPVPGGVGPMTVAHLLVNTVRATEYQTYHEEKALVQ